MNFRFPVKLQKLLPILAVCSLMETNSFAGDYWTVWRSDMITDDGVHQIGKSWTDIDGAAFNPNLAGAAVWTSGCNPINKTHIEIGTSEIPESLRPITHLEAGKMVKTLPFARSLIQLSEISPTFPNTKGRIQIRLKGTVDFCDDTKGPVRIPFSVSCSTAADSQGKFYQNLMIPGPAFPTKGHSLSEFDQTAYIDFDTTNCDADMTLHASIGGAENISIPTFEVIVWAN